MALPIVFKVTNAGKFAALSASENGAQIKLNLTQVAIGAGKYVPVGSETALRSEVGTRSSIVSGDVEIESNTLRFSSSMSANTLTPVYEIGLMTDTGVLFAVAASATEPLFTIHTGITFVAAFGLSLSEVAANSVTVVTDPNGALSIVIMQQHLAAQDPHPQYVTRLDYDEHVSNSAIEHENTNNWQVDHLTKPNPHPQYVNQERFKLLLNTLIPIGYLHHTHIPVNPKPLFDELLGVDTFWRRIIGRMMIASDPNDPFINGHGMVLGQKGLTTLVGDTRPQTYPLQTTHIFERYNPDDVIDTVWVVKANKLVVGEGDAVRFTVSANNLPDGQILNWSVKEGLLNVGQDDIVAPEKSDSGSVILRDEQAIIDFVTTPDDNAVEALKYVRLVVGAPANIAINVPIADKGFNETVINITESTNKGIVLDELYKTAIGAYPSVGGIVRFIVGNGVDIVAPNTGTPAIQDGTNWLVDSQVIIENRGRILGLGGAGGRSAEWLSTIVVYLPSEINTDSLWEFPKVGGDGGTAVKGKFTVDNYGTVAGGGGGGGGGGAIAYAKKSSVGTQSYIIEVVGSCGSGGGAPYGARSPNANTIESMYKHYVEDNHLPFDHGNYAQPLRLVQIDSSSGVTQFLLWHLLNNGVFYKTIPFKNPSFKLASPAFSIPSYHSDGISYNIISRIHEPFVTDKTLPFIVHEGVNFYQNYSVTLKQSTAGGLITGGSYGYGGGCVFGGVSGSNSLLTLNHFELLDLSLHHGGGGGGLGVNGGSGVNIVKSSLNKLVGYETGVYTKIREIAPAAGGLAGLISEGAVTINNIAGGVTKGRAAP